MDLTLTQVDFFVHLVTGSYIAKAWTQVGSGNLTVKGILDCWLMDMPQNRLVISRYMYHLNI